MSRERRIHPRTTTSIGATLRAGAAVLEGVVENVGTGGVFFSTGDLEAELAVGDSVVVVLQAADGATAEVPGAVLRAERYFDGSEVRRSFAVKFDAEIDVASLGVAG